MIHSTHPLKTAIIIITLILPHDQFVKQAHTVILELFASPEVAQKWDCPISCSDDVTCACSDWSASTLTSHQP